MLTCDEAEPELSAYLDGELNPQERAAVEAHMVLCENCNAVLNEIEFARKALMATPKLSVSEEFSGKLKEAIRADASRASSVVRAPSSHAIRAVQQVYELAEFGEPPPLVPVQVKRVFPWSTVFSAVAAILMVSLMGYVVFAPSADQLASLTEKMSPNAKVDTHVAMADRAAAGEPADGAAKGTLPPVTPATAAARPPLQSDVPEMRARSMDAAPMRKSAQRAKERLDEPLKQSETKSSEQIADAVKDNKAKKEPGFNAAPAAKKGTEEKQERMAPASPPAPAVPPPLPAPVTKPGASGAAPKPSMIAPKENRTADESKPGAGANGADKYAMQKGEANFGGGRRLSADPALELSDAKGAGPMVIRIRTRDLEKSNARLAAIAKDLNAELVPTNEAAKAGKDFSMIAPASKRTALINALFLLQAEGANTAGKYGEKEVAASGNKNAAAAAEKSDRAMLGAAEKAKAPSAEKGDEKFTVKIELIGE